MLNIHPSTPVAVAAAAAAAAGLRLRTNRRGGWMAVPTTAPLPVERRRAVWQQPDPQDIAVDAYYRRIDAIAVWLKQQPVDTLLSMTVPGSDANAEWQRLAWHVEQIVGDMAAILAEHPAGAQ
jgi:hypothetical protein